MSSRYQEWLIHVFDHEVKDPQWYFDIDAPEFSASPTEITELLSRTFLHAGKDLSGYTDAQVDQGFWYIVSVSGSDFMFALKSSDVPLKARSQAIRNIQHLYSDCFAKRCDESLGHLGEKGSPLNSICYMFWDVCPVTCLEGVPDKVELEDAIFTVLEGSLAIKHRACREGALHGLGEMACFCPDRVQHTIDRFLKDANLDEALLAYARKAREGNVL